MSQLKSKKGRKKHLTYDDEYASDDDDDQNDVNVDDDLLLQKGKPNKATGKRRGARASSKCRENQPRQSKGKNTESEPKKWSSEETNQLIDLFEERPCLWDVFNKSYHDREKRDKAYVEIKTELSVPVNEIKAKLLKLRSQLGREINKTSKTKSGQGTDELYKPTWVCWEKLQFLRTVMQPGKSRDNLQDTLNPDVPSPASADTEDVNTSIESEEVNQKPSSARQSKKSMELKRQELLTTCINVLKEPVKEPVQESNSKPALCSFSLYVSGKLAQFDKRTRSQAERMISNILFDLEELLYTRSAPANMTSNAAPGSTSLHNNFGELSGSLSSPTEVQNNGNADIMQNSNGPFMRLLQQ